MNEDSAIRTTIYTRLKDLCFFFFGPGLALRCGKKKKENFLDLWVRYLVASSSFLLSPSLSLHDGGQMKYMCVRSST